MHKKKLAGLCVLGCAALLLALSDTMRAACTQAAERALQTVAPGLFPFLLLSEFTAAAGLLQPRGRKAQWLAQRLFGVPAAALPAVLFGLTAGYPVGVKTAAALCENGSISPREAHSLVCFCQSPGLAFCIAAVGGGMYGSTGHGWLLFASCTAAALFCAQLRRGRGHAPAAIAPPPAVQAGSLSAAFVEGVRRAAAGILSITAWIAAFAPITVVCDRLPVQIGNALRLAAEVTEGCTLAGQKSQLPLGAAVLGFGGLCVACQLLPELQKIGMRLPVFLGWRLLNGGLAWLFCRALCALLPEAVAAGAGTGAVRVFSVSPAASVLLLLACVIFVLDLAHHKKMCYTVS